MLAVTRAPGELRGRRRAAADPGRPSSRTLSGLPPTVPYAVHRNGAEVRVGSGDGTLTFAPGRHLVTPGDLAPGGFTSTIGLDGTRLARQSSMPSRLCTAGRCSPRSQLTGRYVDSSCPAPAPASPAGLRSWQRVRLRRTSRCGDRRRSALRGVASTHGRSDRRPGPIESRDASARFDQAAVGRRRHWSSVTPAAVTRADSSRSPAVIRRRRTGKTRATTGYHPAGSGPNSSPTPVSPRPGAELGHGRAQPGISGRSND